MNNQAQEWIPVDISGINEGDRESTQAPEIIIWYPTPLMPCYLVCPGHESDYSQEHGLVSVVFSVFGYILAGEQGIVIIYEQGE